jgi:hypothetical protein
MGRLKICLTVASFLLIGEVSKARADIIGVQFSGTVTQVPLLDPQDPFFGTIGANTAFTGSYTFDKFTPDALPADPNTGSYSVTGNPFGLALNIAGNTFSTSDFLNIGIANDFAGVDQYTVLAQFTSGEPFTIELFFQDNSGTKFGSDAQPPAPNLAGFTFNSLFVDALVNGNQVQINGVIDSMSSFPGIPLGPYGGGVTPVPEPFSIVLLASVWLAVCLGLRRRNQQT